MSFLSGLFSPAKPTDIEPNTSNLSSDINHDPLSLTPVVESETNPNKRALNHTPPPIENKVSRNEQEIEASSKQLDFEHSEPVTAKMSEHHAALVQSISKYFDAKFETLSVVTAQLNLNWSWSLT